MNTKGNRRLKMTKKVIQEALIDLLQEKEIVKVSVTELCKTADINRSTFYAHYQDVMAVLEEIVSDFIDKMIVVQEEDIEPQVIHILQYIYNNKKLLLLLLKSDFGFRYKLLGKVTEALVREFPLKNNHKDDGSNLMLHYGFMAAGSLYLLEQWARDEVRISTDQLKQLILSFSNIQEKYI